MKPYSDQDIEVLGSSQQKPQRTRKGKGLYWVLTIIVIVLTVAVMILLFLLKSKSIEPEEEIPVECNEITAEVVPSESEVKDWPEEYTDSINDVPFKVVCLDGYKVSVSFEKPNYQSTDVVLATAAADFRADNGKIVGEFIHNGEELSTGKRKPGFCYVSTDGVLSIGIGNGEEQKQNALQNGGTFFRQYALVMDGEIQPNILKGKAKRRAVAFLDGKPVVVLTLNRESIYDFSQALADYGFSHALYLPGGEGYLHMHTNKVNISSNRPPLTENSNYLIFSK